MQVPGSLLSVHVPNFLTVSRQKISQFDCYWFGFQNWLQSLKLMCVIMINDQAVGILFTLPAGFQCKSDLTSDDLSPQIGFLRTTTSFHNKTLLISGHAAPRPVYPTVEVTRGHRFDWFQQIRLLKSHFCVLCDTISLGDLKAYVSLCEKQKTDLFARVSRWWHSNYFDL